MPILSPEPDLFPADLFTGTGAALATEKAWWVLHVKPRQEKSLARDLNSSQIAFYLPLVSHHTQSRGRRFTSQVPLFAGYVFLHADRDQRVAALSTARVVHSLNVADQQGLWRDLTQIFQLIRSGAPITPEDHLAPGVMVEIRHGALAGLRGKIIESASRRRFVVQVDFIQRGASVLLQDVDLAPVLPSSHDTRVNQN